MGMYLGVWQKWLDFSGRATRSEYWLFVIMNYVVLFALMGILIAMEGAAAYGESEELGPAFWIYIVFIVSTLIPQLAVSVRRLHDSGHSGMWILIKVVPGLGGIVLFVLLVLNSEKRDNQYGPYGGPDVEVFD